MANITYDKKPMSATVLLVFFASVLLLPTAQATTPMSVTGPVQVQYPSFTFVRAAGTVTFFTITESDVYSGAFSGTTLGDSALTVDSSGNFTIHGLQTFTGTVNGIPGTLTFQIDALGTFGVIFQGQFVILRGTGGLSNLHGQGTLQGIPGFAGTYTAQIHFDPSQ